MLKMIVVAAIGAIIGWHVGVEHTGYTKAICPEEHGQKVVASYHKKDDMTCVYVKPMETYGRSLKRRKV